MSYLVTFGRCLVVSFLCALTTNVAAQVDHRPAQSAVKDGTLDGAYAEPEKANMLRRVTFAPFDPRLRAVVEPTPGM